MRTTVLLRSDLGYKSLGQSLLGKLGGAKSNAKVTCADKNNKRSLEVYEIFIIWSTRLDPDFPSRFPFQTTSGRSVLQGGSICSYLPPSDPRQRPKFTFFGS